MSESRFDYDVFLSHSPKDMATVRALANRLKKEGLKVWFREWELKGADPGAVAAMIEQGLERSRVLMLCLSANAYGPDWPRLEGETFRFRDPKDEDRRFIPLRLDDAPVKDSLAGLAVIDWRPSKRIAEYQKLQEACRRPGKPDQVKEQTSPALLHSLYLVGLVRSVSYSSDGTRALSGGRDGTLREWELDTGRCLRVLEGHEGDVYSVTYGGGGARALSGGSDGTLREWDLQEARCLRVLEGHEGDVYSVKYGGGGARALSGGYDGTLREWDLQEARCLRVLEGHDGYVNSVTYVGGGARALSGGSDGTARVWELGTGRCLRVLEGHKGPVLSVSFDGSGARALSGGRDGTLREWELGTGRCLRVLEGHKGPVWSVTYGGGGARALSGGGDGTLREWELGTGRCLRVLKGHTDAVWSVSFGVDANRAISTDSRGYCRIWDLTAIPESEADQVLYTNAKVLLVGENGVGKTGLSNYLARGIKVEDDKPLPSTDGAWATHWSLPHDATKDGIEREVWLWDFAGQVDYRLVHQLFMDDTAAAVLVFNPQQENPFESLGQWDRDLQKAARRSFVRLIAAGRIDRGGLVVSAASMERFILERGFQGPLHLTSAKTAEGCAQLRDAIVQAIDWSVIPETTSTVLYHRMKQEILNLRDGGLILIRLGELKQRMELALSGWPFTLQELNTVIGLMTGPGMIQKLDFGGFILLRPEVLSRYAAAVVRKVRTHPQELGCISEEEFLTGDLDYQDFQRLHRDEEEVILRALLETFVSRAWCLRQQVDGKSVLTFPSYFRRERPDQPAHPSVLVTYRFDGPTDEVYATGVVLLHHTLAFDVEQLWRSAADFKTLNGKKLGFILNRENEGTTTLDVYFERDVDENARMVFLRYVHEHLTKHAQNVVRLRNYYCQNMKCRKFDQVFADRELVHEAAAEGGEGKVFCPGCGKPIQVRDAIEEKFDSPKVIQQVQEMQDESKQTLDTESLELILEGHAKAIVAEAGQIPRGYTNSDHGIDGEIEFKDDRGRATGKRLYLQLKSGDSYLKSRKRDGAEIFQIKNPRWREYWQQQAYPVMLVIRTSDGVIRWMDVSETLKRQVAAGRPVTQIVFEGEPFDPLSVRRWRDRILGISRSAGTFVPGSSSAPGAGSM